MNSEDRISKGGEIVITPTLMYFTIRMYIQDYVFMISLKELCVRLKHYENLNLRS